MPKNSTPEKDEFDPILLLISLCGEQDRFFSWYMKSPYRRAEELSPLLAEFVRAGAIALLAPGWRLGGSHTSPPIPPTWSDADSGVFHSIVFSPLLLFHSLGLLHYNVLNLFNLKYLVSTLKCSIFAVE